MSAARTTHGTLPYDASILLIINAINTSSSKNATPHDRRAHKQSTQSACIQFKPCPIPGSKTPTPLSYQKSRRWITHTWETLKQRQAHLSPQPQDSSRPLYFSAQRSLVVAYLSYLFQASCTLALCSICRFCLVLRRCFAVILAPTRIVACVQLFL